MFYVILHNKFKIYYQKRILLTTNNYNYEEDSFCNGSFRLLFVC